MAPDQSLNKLSVEPLPCLFKSHKFPLKGSPKKMVLNSLREDVVDGDVHLLNQCVDTDHKFKRDKSDNDECVDSQPDPGQTLSCLFKFFFRRKM